MVEQPYNVVYILTDDQRWDTLCYGAVGLSGLCAQPAADHPMPSVETELMGPGVVFTRAFAQNPLCCPARAGLLSGGFSSFHTNVLSNGEPNGGAAHFSDSVTLATLLQQQGYKTALIGRYLTEYHELVDKETFTGYVPPGWDRFVGLAVETRAQGFLVLIGSSSFNQSGTGTLEPIPAETYVTDYFRDEALAFIDQTCGSQGCASPFFLLLGTSAPHRPATPAPRHEGLFANYLYRDRGWEEQPDGDLGDKPIYVQTQAATWDRGGEDEFHSNQLESLRAADEAVDAILSDLDTKGLLSQTVIIFSSDNGMMWGEHFLPDKAKPYEESIRVPLVILYPALLPRAVDKLVAADLDVGPTILELAGAAAIGGDGMSLLPLLLETDPGWRQESLFVSFEQAIPAWAAIRTDDDWKYVEYVTGEKELYSLVEDPFELTSRHNDPAYQEVLTDLAGRLAQLDRGVAIKMDNLPDPQRNKLPTGRVGRAYSFQLSAWGGNGTYVWSILTGEPPCTGSLPDGLGLSTDGLLSGTPTASGSWQFCIKVQDTSQSPQPGNDRPQEMAVKFKLSIKAARPEN